MIGTRTRNREFLLLQLLFFVFCSLFLFLVPGLAAFADDCLPYKLNPSVKVNSPIWQKQVVQPLKPMDLWHGNVVATLVEDYEIIGDTTSIEDGFCVSLKDVSANIGYSDFQVKIDSRHRIGTCEYNAILAHEDEHIRAYLSVIEDYHSDIVMAVNSAVNSIVPVFVNNESEVENALDLLNQKLQSHPDLILMNQRIQAEQEIRNKRIDLSDTGKHLQRCMH